MLTRRTFNQLLAASAAASALKPGHLFALDAQPINDISVMMWTMKKLGTFEENLERVAQAGYRCIELTDEYKHWSPEEKQRILARIKALGVQIDAVTGVTRGFADPAGASAYVAELSALIPSVKELGCSQLILMSGKRLDNMSAGATADAQHRASIETLTAAAPVLAAAGITGLIEPIDRIENPPIYLDGVTEAFAIANAVSSPNVKVLYDLYHEQRGYGNLIEKLNANIAQVGLVHVADVPGRHAPGTGEIDYTSIYRRLAALHYTGRIAMEFYPADAADIVPSLRRAREEALRALTSS
jgi:hydroxypyruvate isomerase